MLKKVYLVTLHVEDEENEVYVFPTEEARRLFIQDVKQRYPEAGIAATEEIVIREQ